MHTIKTGEIYKGRDGDSRKVVEVGGDNVRYCFSSMCAGAIWAVDQSNPHFARCFTNRTHDSDGNPVNNQQEKDMTYKKGEWYRGEDGSEREVVAVTREGDVAYYNHTSDFVGTIEHSSHAKLKRTLEACIKDADGKPVKPKNPLTKELLLRDAGAWNKAREDNPDMVPNFAGADLSRLALKDRNLVGADLSGANLSRSILSGCNFAEADLSNANLEHAILERTIMCQATIDGARVRPEDIGGPGHILYALTEEEAAHVKRCRI